MKPQLVVILVVLSIWALVGIVALTRVALKARHRRLERRRRLTEGDPLDTLVLQLRLGQMATELQRLTGSHSFAAAHHWRAAQAAYDALLAEACHRAGLDVVVPLRATEISKDAERLREELELASRGWSW